MKRRSILIGIVLVFLVALLLLRMNFDRQYDAARARLDAVPVATAPP